MRIFATALAALGLSAGLMAPAHPAENVQVRLLDGVLRLAVPADIPEEDIGLNQSDRELGILDGRMFVDADRRRGVVVLERKVPPAQAGETAADLSRAAQAYMAEQRGTVSGLRSVANEGFTVSGLPLHRLEWVGAVLDLPSRVTVFFARAHGRQAEVQVNTGYRDEAGHRALVARIQASLQATLPAKP
ncbi:hypothetical protein BRI6_3597 [plant metagenome]|uniref:Uncharacterized protein n=1 Tax=plant metagenome TaxID=1297885 RepID=A0A484SXR5_9ZZZZ